jgi:hypothetical protein
VDAVGVAVAVVVMQVSPPYANNGGMRNRSPVTVTVRTLRLW